MIRFFLAASALALTVTPAHADWRKPSTEAHRLAHETIIVDGHVDIPYRLQKSGEDIARLTHTGNFDYPRALAGGLNAPFMAIYVAASYQEDANGGAFEQANALIDLVEGIASAQPGKFAVAKSVSDVKQITKSGRIALPMGMENGAAIGHDVDNVDYFRDRGVRYISLAHSRANQLSDSSYDINRPNGGISELGAEVVQRMNDVGVMIDVSHISDDAFWDIMEITRAPVMASHSSARKFTGEDFERNLADDMIVRIGENNGVIMVNFGSSFLTDDYRQWSNKKNLAYQKYVSETGVEHTEEERAAWMDAWTIDNPTPFADVDDVLDHIDHIVSLAGIDHVGLGSDFDGVGDSLPTGLKDASDLPNLVQGLMDRGYSHRDIQKILSGNALRVWRDVEKAAVR